MTLVHTVTCEFAEDDIENAKALRDIINELGYNATVTSRSLETNTFIMSKTRYER